MTSKLQAEIGIFGGSGLYEFFKDLPAGKAGGEWLPVSTPYGKPSDKVFLTEYKGKKVAFMPRHGKKHQFPPHKINYQANLFAFKRLGVKRIIAPAAVGSLQPNVQRGDFVICDQFVDRTKNRKDTFFDGPTSRQVRFRRTVHVSAADSYCPELRKIAIKACQRNKIRAHNKGTVVIIQGPRFSTRAESKWFSKMGWEVINMTQYPEAILAKELEMCYVNISLVTDYDVGLTVPVSSNEVVKVFNQNIKNVKKVILDMIEMIPEKQSCKCSEALKGAEI